MVWKLREGKVPSKQWMADLLAYLEQSHGIAPTREVVEKLYLSRTFFLPSVSML